MKIIVPLVCTLFLLGCNDTASTDKTAPVQNNNAIEQEVNVTSANEPEAVTPQIAEVVSTQTTVNTTETETKSVNKVKPEPKQSPAPKEVKVPKVAIETTHTVVDATALFGTKCASCHGTKAEKQALGKSQVIAGWSASKTEEALNGYKSGSYGKEMKAIMQGQTKSLNSEEIKALAKHISTL